MAFRPASLLTSAIAIASLFAASTVAHASSVVFTVSFDTTGTNIDYAGGFFGPFGTAPSVTSASWQNTLQPGDKVVYLVTLDSVADLYYSGTNNNGGDPAQNRSSWDATNVTATLYRGNTVISTASGFDCYLDVMDGQVVNDVVEVAFIKTITLGDFSNTTTIANGYWELASSGFSNTSISNIFTPGLNAGLNLAQAAPSIIDTNDAEGSQYTMTGFSAGSVLLEAPVAVPLPAPAALTALGLGIVGLLTARSKKRQQVA